MIDDVTDDLFFGGRLRLLQPKRGHRFGGDAALLVAAARSRLEAGAFIADLGAGVGAVGLALAQAGAARATLVEIDEGLGRLASENAQRNGLPDHADIVVSDVADIGAAQGVGGLDLVVMNPPFDDEARFRASPEAMKARAHVDGGDVVAVWTAAAARLLKPGGSLVLIHRPEALGGLLAALGERFGDVRVRPLHPRAAAPAGRMLVAARLDARGPLALLQGLVMHGPDGRFTAEADAAQRGEAEIDMA